MELEKFGDNDESNGCDVDRTPKFRRLCRNIIQMIACDRCENST